MGKMGRSRKGSLIQSEKGVDWTAGQEDTLFFNVLYKGDRVAGGEDGEKYVQEVLSQFEDYESIGSKISTKESEKIANEEGTALVINSKKIVCIHKSRREITNEDSPHNITFTCVLPITKQYETFAYISRNVKLNMCRCHVFTCTAGTGDAISAAVAKAREEYKENAQKGMVNPFAANKHAPRIVPKGELFNKQIHRADIEAIEVIGSGQFGAVYLATQSMRKCPVDGKLFAIDGHLKRYMELLEKKGKNVDWKQPIDKVPVRRAVKMLKGSATPAAREEFLREAETMLKFDHPNVTVIEGVAVQQPPWLYVIQYCMYGDLRQVLKSCRQRRFYLRPKELLFLATGILAGMTHIRSKGMIHLDLAARNCLLAENNVVKVADFGLTRALPPGENYILIKDRGIKLAIKWLAPEALKSRRFSEASDIWAYAVTCWELYSYGDLPYPEMKNDETQKSVLRGEILPMPRGTPEPVQIMLKQMFSFDYHKRGTFSEHLRLCTSLLSRDATTVRDVGKMLNDPELAKLAKEEARKADELRKKKAQEAREKRTEIIFQTSKEQSTWWQEDTSKRDAETIVLSNPYGSFLVRKESEERLVLVVNENGQPSHYPIKVELPVPQDKNGAPSYVFGGRPHSSCAEIIGNLRFAPFRGRLGKNLKLTQACPSMVTKLSQPFDPSNKGNPLFDGGDGAVPV